MTETPFDAYCRRKEKTACTAALSGYQTVFDHAAGQGLRPIGNDWTRALFDGPFYVREPASGTPALSLVFVQSREGNTVADDPSTLGGGDTDTHLIYEGLSRVTADAVLAGAATARGEETVFSVWHPQFVALRREGGKPRHPAQVVVTASGDLPFDRGLMFTTPALTGLHDCPIRPRPPAASSSSRAAVGGGHRCRRTAVDDGRHAASERTRAPRHLRGRRTPHGDVIDP